MTNTVIGVYDTFAHAQGAMQKLQNSGFGSNQIGMQPSDNSPQARASALRTVGSTTSQQSQQEEGTLRSFFSDLFGASDDNTQTGHADHYAEAVRRGSFVLTVDARDEDQRELAASVMEQFDPVDIDARTSFWKESGWDRHDERAAPLDDDEILRERTAYAQRAGATSDQKTIPLVAEQLQVGKREVQRGGIRVIQRVIETPVEETVSLRQEHVTIERHAVDAPATGRNLDAFKEETFELREMAEEAVVAKTARVVEEVVISKEITQKETTISDSVRRTDVEVEQLNASETEITRNPG